MDGQTINVATSLIGGAGVGLGASILYWSIGRVAGVSGILAGALRPMRHDWVWRIAFLFGLFVAGTLLSALVPQSHSDEPPSSWMLMLAAGICVGFGARLAGGCTSGHGICGVSRMRVRSIVATSLFMLSGAVVVFVVRHWMGAS